jgi:hypothetical protein
VLIAGGLALRVRHRGARAVKRFLRENSLTVVFLVLFLAPVVGEAFVGHSDFNHAQVAHQDETISLGRYVTSSAFMADVMENWQSEYLQFTLFILAPSGSSSAARHESKPPGEEGGESDEEQKVGEHAKPDSPSGPRPAACAPLVLRTRSCS